MIYVPLITYLALLFFALAILTYACRRAHNWLSTLPAIVTAAIVGIVGVTFAAYRINDLNRKGASLETWQLIAASVIYVIGAFILWTRFRQLSDKQSP